MKKLDNNGYITSILLLLIIIPVILLLIITIEQDNHYVNNTAENIENNKLTSITSDFENEITILTKETLHNMTKEVILTNNPYDNSTKIFKSRLQENINQNQEKYYNNSGCILNCTIINIKAADNPFQIEIIYSLKTTFNSKNKIEKNNKIYVNLTEGNYEIYDPLPTLRTGVKPTNNFIEYNDKLSNIIQIENSTVYNNTREAYVIKKCPYDEYTKHGHNNTIIANCVNNHYYHESHDGLCILCRLENKSTCSHRGLETFIISTQERDRAPVSIDHVLFNMTENGQYAGNKIILNNTTVIYLDNGHKLKYGL
ncbi:hypothetical protein [Methanosphaera sp. WGK6]|uniref:hypothetical protein n=1 Tax=Methanosphaera sp. WGK6 TaxID=1561964 RepID=UPI00084C81BE|nr:hypothetical protein [Methanosphaera sp. WGK6]